VHILACFLLALGIPAALAGASAPAVILDVWPGRPPGEENFRPPAPNPKAPRPKDDGTLRVALVTQPRLMIFRPSPERANGTAIVVCPGGGYHILAWTKEGTEIAEWLNSIGVTAAVLEYRVPRRDPKQPHLAPLQDAQRALRHVREKAGDWRVDPERVGILGFSAGGHLAVMAALHSGESG
jgi:acetyl esterase/lipase